MSGRKRSQYQLNAEAAARAEVLRREQEAWRAAAALETQVRATLSGLRAADRRAGPARDAEAWLGGTASGLPGLEARVTRGREVLARMRAASAEAGREEAALRLRAERLERSLAGARRALAAWLDEAGRTRLETALGGVGELLEKGRRSQAEGTLAKAESQAVALIEAAERRRAEEVRRDLLREAGAQAAALAEVAGGVAAVLGLEEARPGLRETFGREGEEARRWLTAANRGLETAGEDGDDAELARRRDGLAAAVEAGRERLRELEAAYVTEAASWSARLGAELSELGSGFAESREALEKWRLEGTGELAGVLERASEELAMGRYRRLESGGGLGRGRELLRSLGGRARELEELESRRTYLLRCLRSVCADMGFQEEGEPAHETAGDPRSRLVARWDTRTEGLVTFHLALEDQLAADSCISDHGCGRDFQALSSQLHERFGVRTEFTTEDGEPLYLPEDEVEVDEAETMDGRA